MARVKRRRYHLEWSTTSRSVFMFDQMLGLVLAILALVYLGYAMLRPERF